MYHGWKQKTKKPAHFPLKTQLCCHQSAQENAIPAIIACLLLTCGHAKKRKKKKSLAACKHTDLNVPPQI